MLIIWNNELLISDQDLLYAIDQKVRFWPRSWTPIEIENGLDPTSWWISFSKSSFGLLWIVKKPVYSKIIYCE